MRIVLLTTNLAVGGAEAQVALLAKGLREHGHAVDVISLLEPTAFRSELESAGVGVHAPGLARMPALLRSLRPEIVHCHMFHANILGRLLRIVLPFPALISTIHSAAESKRSDRSGRSLRWRDVAYRLTDPLTDAVVCVSRDALHRHLRRGAITGGLVIPNAIDTHRFRPDPALRLQVRQQLGLAASEFVWMAVGRLMWKKNFNGLIDSFRPEQPARLLLVGSGPDEAELKAQAAGRDDILFLGERRDIPALLNAADGFVLSSVVEGLPVALLEAAACGLPCVAADVGGVRETGIGIVVAHEELAEAMRTVEALDVPLRERMGREARAVVEARYSLPAVVDEWEALYTRLLQSSM